MLTKLAIAGMGALLAVAPAYALNGKAYEGTWTGALGDGTPVVLQIPAGVGSGAPVSYSYNNQDQGPQTPTVQGNKIRLDNPSGTYMLIGPAKGNQLPYFWTNGAHKASTVLTRQ